MTLTDQAREKGTETATCPTCGSELGLVELPDGSVSHKACAKCYGTKAKEAAKQTASAPVARERGTRVEHQEEE